MHEADLNTGSSSLSKQSLENAVEFEESASAERAALHYLCIYVSRRGQRSRRGPSSAKRARLAERRRSRMDPASININKIGNTDPRAKRCSFAGERRTGRSEEERHFRARARADAKSIISPARDQTCTEMRGILDSIDEKDEIRASTSLNDRDGSSSRIG